MNNIMNDIVTFFNELSRTKGHNQGIMNEKLSQFSAMNNTVNNKKGGNTVNVKQLCS